VKFLQDHSILISHNLKKVSFTQTAVGRICIRCHNKTSFQRLVLLIG